MSTTPPMTPPAIAPATIIKLGQESGNDGKGMPVYGHTLRMVYLYIYIHTPLSWQTKVNISHICKLKEGSSRLHQDITGTKKSLSFTGALKSSYIMPEY